MTTPDVPETETDLDPKQLDGDAGWYPSLGELQLDGGHLPPIGTGSEGAR